MIAYLQGTIIHKNNPYLIIDVQQVGYKVFTTDSLRADLMLDETYTIWTYHALRDTASDLYGFQQESDVAFFELLLTVSGIGPKGALGIMNTAPAATIIEGIQKNDLGHLTKIAGISKKNAEKILLALKDKVGNLTIEPSTSNETSISTDAIEALIALGYTETDARDKVRNLNPDKDMTTEQIIKLALAKL